MKKIIFSVCCVLFVAIFLSSPAAAGPVSYIGLYTDGGHSICEQFISSPYVPFIVYVWVLPSDNGIICASFKLTAPLWLSNVGLTLPPGIIDINPHDPFGDDGDVVCFAECQYDWAWFYQLTMMPMTAGLKDILSVEKKPGTSYVTANSCLEGNPAEPMIVLNDLLLNQHCYVGASSSCWGAIKSICGVE